MRNLITELDDLPDREQQKQQLGARHDQAVDPLAVAGLRSAIVVALIAIATPLPAASLPELGVLDPSIELRGATARGCGYDIRPAAADRTWTDGTQVPSGGPFELIPGDYFLFPRCRTGDQELIGLPSKVRIAAGAISRPSVVMAAAPIRVEARRDGVLRPARVQLFDPSQELRGAPIMELPANQRRLAPTGRFDVVVTLQASDHPRAEVLLPSTRLEGERLIVLPADLSDGAVVVRTHANGKTAEATVRAFVPGASEDSGQVEAGQRLELPAGRYKLRTELSDTADFGAAEREVWVVAGKLLKLTETFDTGTLLVAVLRDGRPAPGTVYLSRADETESFNYFDAPGTVTLSPGTYQLRLISPELGPVEELRSPPIRVAARSRGRHVFDISRATITARAEQRGRQADAEIELRAAGGGETIQAESVGHWRVWPGRYEFRATHAEGAEIISEPFEVTWGTRLDRTISFQLGRLKVRVLRGNAPIPEAEVLAFRPGASKPIARTRAGQPLELTPGLYDIKAVLGPETVWRPGVRVRGVLEIDLLLPESAPEASLPAGDGDSPPPESKVP